MFKLNYLLLITLLLNSYYCYGFENLLNPFPLENDDFKNSFDLKFNTKKRNINETAGSSESFVFNGLEKYESVPIMFPQDICIFNVDKDKYVSTLYINNEGNREFAIFKYQANTYLKKFETSAPLAVSMDCKSMNEKGFIALAFNLTEFDSDATKGSPIIEISSSGITFVQYFTEQPIKKVQFLVRGNHLYLLQIPSKYQNSEDKLLKCPIFKWTGTNFNQIDKISCKNTNHIEMFLVNSQLFLAVANYADYDFETASVIYRYNLDMKKFELHQTIKTFAAIDVKYFNILLKNGKREHFLVFANSRENGDINRSEESYSVIYKYENNHFIPFEKLLLYSALQFLPVQNSNGEFILLVSCENQDIKILEYNGWKFEDAAVQLTEGALSGGIVNLRTFEDHNETFIVVANQNMVINETNIYRPKFKKFIDIKGLKKEILEWSDTILIKISKINVLTLKQEVEKRMTSYENTTNNIIQFENGNISNVVVKKLHYYKKNMTSSLWDTLKISYKTVRYLETKLNGTVFKVNSSSNITENLSDDFDSINYVVKSDKNIMKINENDQKNTKLLKYERLTNNSENDTLFESDDTLYLKTLIVNEKIFATKINNVTVKDSLHFNNIVAKKIITLDEFQSPSKSRRLENDTDTEPTDTEPMDLPDIRYKTLKVKNLTVTGAINKIDFNLIYSKSLKKFGNQVITKSMTIENLKVTHIRTNNNIINTLNTSKLVLINEGKFVINQDIQFAAPIKAKHVQVNDRINNIHVHQGQLDVLLKYTDSSQVITGIKNFENVDVLEPITLDGKLVGKNFDKFSPIKLVDKDIVLQGNYTIIGDVSIEKILSANNLYDYTSRQNVKDAIKSGIDMNSTEISVAIKFKEPLYVEYLNSSKINSIDIKNFVETGHNDGQYIKGHTTFKGNLTIAKGYFEVFEMNTINVRDLETQILNKILDQNITYRFITTKLSTSQIFSDKITLGSVDLSQVLTRNTKQILSGNVKIETLKTNNAKIENLQTGQSINDINFQKILNPTEKEIYLKDFKEFRGNVNVKHLTIKNYINGRPMPLIKPLLEQLGLGNSIKFYGPIHFANGIRINNIFFNGSLNGIKSDEFGKNWLLSETNQVFTATQKFSSILCDENVVTKTLNTIKFDDLITNTYWLNRDEQVKGMNFGNALFSKGPMLSSGKINEIKFNKEVLQKTATEPQELNCTIKCNNNLYISGHINNTHLNKVDLRTVEHIIRGEVKKITVETAIFEHSPQFETLNLQNVDQLLAEVWMSNEDTTLHGEFEFYNANMTGKVEINGLVNYNDLNFLKENYISLSADQNITAQIYFSNEVIFHNGLSTDFLAVKGIIIDSINANGLNINEFVHNVLQKTGNQIIPGQWIIEEVNVEGNLNYVYINGLRIKDDVVRLDVPNYIRAKKIINSSTIHDLLCEPNSKVNDIFIHNWIQNVVLIDKNYTIQGTTFIDDLTVFNDIEVYGTVNGIIFNENNLLLSSTNQTIHGDVHIITKYPNNRKLLANTIKNLMVDSINGLNVRLFFENLVANTPNKNIDIDSVSLIFKNKLVMESFDGDKYFYELNTENFFKALRHENHASDLIRLADEMHNSIKNIEHIMEDSHYHISHFQHKQTIFTPIQKIVSLKWKNFKKNIDVLAILKGHTQLSIDFYKWDATGKNFVLDKNFRWNSNIIHSILNISKIKLNGVDVLVVQTLYKDKFQHLLYKINNDVLENIYQLSANYSQELINDGARDGCLICYSQFNSLISKFCLDPKAKDVNFIKESSLLKGPIRKIIFLKESVFILVQDALQIFVKKSLEKPIQRLPIYMPDSFVTIEFDDHFYIAVCSKHNSQSLYKGSVEIYKSLNNSYFVHAKTLDVISPIQIDFLKIPETNDLLLYILTENLSEPFVIYKFRGISEFEKILGPSTVPRGTSMNLFNTQNNTYLAAIQFKNGVALIETVINSN